MNLWISVLLTGVVSSGFMNPIHHTNNLPIEKEYHHQYHHENCIMNNDDEKRYEDEYQYDCPMQSHHEGRGYHHGRHQ